VKEENLKKAVVRPVLFSRILLFVVALIGSIIVDHSFDVPKVNFEANIPVLELFANWDTVYYFDIAAKGIVGYHWAFRPLFPLVIGILRLPFVGLGGNESSLVVGIGWNIFALVLAAIYLYKLTELMYDQKSAKKTILLLSISPAAVFFTAPYPESTYLLLMVSSFYYLEKNRMVPATILGLLAGFTRTEGFLIFIPFMLKALFSREKERLQTFFGSVIIFLSLPIWMVFSYLLTADPLISFKIFSDWSKTTLIDVIVNIYNNTPTYGIVIVPISITVLAIAIWTLVTYFFSFNFESKKLTVNFKRSFKDRQMPYFLFATFLSVFFVFIGEIKSFPRYALTLFPILWANSLWINGKTTKFSLLSLLYIGLMILGTVLFTNWYPFI
jgi:hypothetical protein